MQGTRSWPEGLLRRAATLDRACVIHMQKARPGGHIDRTFIFISKLGDGLLWVGILLALPWLDAAMGPQNAARLLALAALNLAVYLWLKPRIARARPCHGCEGVTARTRALDTFSFPSGHTLHAVAFTIVLSHHYPALSLLLWLFCLLVALSRVVLGLHYPTDVIFAAAMAFLTAHLVLLF
jgi:undecaprenyl-diphosphatase